MIKKFVMSNIKHMWLSRMYSILGFTKHSAADNQRCHAVLGVLGHRLKVAQNSYWMASKPSPIKDAAVNHKLRSYRDSIIVTISHKFMVIQ